jgi:hypothetical protein
MRQMMKRHSSVATKRSGKCPIIARISSQYEATTWNGLKSVNW